MLEHEASVRDFIADAFAHCKFIAYAESSRPLLAKVVGDQLDDGIHQSEITARHSQVPRRLPQTALLGSRTEGEIGLAASLRFRI